MCFSKDCSRILSSNLWNVYIIKHDSYSCNKCNILQYKKEIVLECITMVIIRHIWQFCVVSAVNFPSDGRSFLQLDVISLENRSEKVCVRTCTHTKIIWCAWRWCVVFLADAASPCLPDAPVVFSPSPSLWSAAPEWLWEAAAAWWLLGPGLWTASSPSPGAPGMTTPPSSVTSKQNVTLNRDPNCEIIQSPCITQLIIRKCCFISNLFTTVSFSFFLNLDFSTQLSMWPFWMFHKHCFHPKVSLISQDQHDTPLCN